LEKVEEEEAAEAGCIPLSSPEEDLSWEQEEEGRLALTLLEFGLVQGPFCCDLEEEE
jgi:hypothetical protein